MAKSPLLMKTCSHCNQQKPLSAFLQLAGTMGTVYGNICASCRKITGEKNDQSKEKEDSTTSRTELKIDSKSKTHEEIDKKQLFKQTEELYYEEREKKTETRQLANEKTTQIKAKEEKHRQYLTTRSFLSNTKKPSDTNQPIFGSVQHIAKETKIDLTVPMLDTQVKEKYNSPEFKRLQTFFGKNAPISRFIEQTIKQDVNIDEKETLSDAAENLFGSRRG